MYFHWTDKFIVKSKRSPGYNIYDEAGLYLATCYTREEAREQLIKYSKQLEKQS